MEKFRLATEEERYGKSAGCFHRTTFTASVDELTALLGEENVGKAGDGKTLHEWSVIFNDKMFAIYDWKEYRDFPADERIEWHVGSCYDSIEDGEFADAIKEALKSNNH